MAAEQKTVQEVEEEFGIDVDHYDVNLKSADGLLKALQAGLGADGSTKTTTGKKFIIGGNWKANGTKKFVDWMVDLLNKTGPILPHVEVVVAPTHLHLHSVMNNLRSDIAVCAQNCALSPKEGAFTGEIIASQLKDFGINWTIVGHSERRAGFGGPGETNEVVATKTKVALDAGLNVITCIGETLAEREAGKTTEVLETQLAALTKTVTAADWNRVVLAYEPVWAIGTGKTATPAQAQETHAAIRAWAGKNVSPDAASALRIMYGGSVNAGNAKELAACDDVDGFLVGGASLKEDFVTIMNAPEDKVARNITSLFDRLNKLSDAMDHICHDDDLNHDFLVKAFDPKNTGRLADLQTVINGQGNDVAGDAAGGIKLLMKNRPEDVGTEPHWLALMHLMHCWQGIKAAAGAKKEVAKKFNENVTQFDLLLKKAEKHIDVLESGELTVIKKKKNVLELWETLAKIAHIIQEVCHAEDGNHGFMARSFDRYTQRLQRLEKIINGGADLMHDKPPTGGVKLMMETDSENMGEHAHKETMDDLVRWYKMAFTTACSDLLKHLSNTGKTDDRL